MLLDSQNKTRSFHIGNIFDVEYELIDRLAVHIIKSEIEPFIQHIKYSSPKILLDMNEVAKLVPCQEGYFPTIRWNDYYTICVIEMNEDVDNTTIPRFKIWIKATDEDSKRLLMELNKQHKEQLAKLFNR